MATNISIINRHKTFLLQLITYTNSKNIIDFKLRALKCRHKVPLYFIVNSSDLRQRKINIFCGGSIGRTAS